MGLESRAGLASRVCAGRQARARAAAWATQNVKPLNKYVGLLERELEYLRNQLALARSDIEFYRGKVERLELSIMSNANVPAQQSYAERSEPVNRQRFNLSPATPPKIPFRDLKMRWAAMSEKEQEKAIEDGWNVDAKKEESNAGIE